MGEAPKADSAVVRIISSRNAPDLDKICRTAVRAAWDTPVETLPSGAIDWDNEDAFTLQGAVDTLYPLYLDFESIKPGDTTGEGTALHNLFEAMVLAKTSRFDSTQYLEDVRRDIQHALGRVIHEVRNQVEKNGVAVTEPDQYRAVLELHNKVPRIEMAIDRALANLGVAPAVPGAAR